MTDTVSRKTNWPIITAFGLPIALILGVFLYSLAPWQSVETKYNFVYVTCTSPDFYSYDCHNLLNLTYSVDEETGKIIKKSEEEINADLNSDLNYNYLIRQNKLSFNNESRIFVYDSALDQSREITLAEAEGYNISNLTTSPDGVFVSGDWNYSADFFPFSSGRSSYENYLVRGSSKKKINLITGDRYSSNFKFIGWIL